jgi:hypothetical protein
MPLIRKRRIWWEPVAGAVAYLVYVNAEGKTIDPDRFTWREAPGVISRRVAGYTEIVLPDEWPEFPEKPGTYVIAITARDDAGNESDPLLLTGVFNFVAPPSPSKGGIETFPLPTAEPEILHGLPSSSGQTLISRGMEEVRNNEQLGEAYLGAGAGQRRPWEPR